MRNKTKIAFGLGFGLSIVAATVGIWFWKKRKEKKAEIDEIKAHLAKMEKESQYGEKSSEDLREFNTVRKRLTELLDELEGRNPAPQKDESKAKKQLDNQRILHNPNQNIFKSLMHVDVRKAGRKPSKIGMLSSQSGGETHKETWKSFGPMMFEQRKIMRRIYKKQKYKDLDNKEIKFMKEKLRKVASLIIEEENQEKLHFGVRSSVIKKDFNTSDDVILFFFDGTSCSEAEGKKHSNIVRMKKLFSRDYKHVKYFSGPGTRDWFESTHASNECTEIVELAYFDLCEIVQRNNLKTPKIYAFGFSRGAFCALSFVNMIRVCGITHGKEKEAMKYYKKNRKARENIEGISREVQFLGLFDCVSTILFGNEFHQDDTTNCLKVIHFVSLQEERCMFLNHPPKGEKVKTVLFAGDHCDCGGGHTDDPHSNICSNVTICEMINESGLKVSQSNETVEYLKNFKSKEEGYDKDDLHGIEVHNESDSILWKGIELFYAVGRVNRAITKNKVSIHSSVFFFVLADNEKHNKRLKPLYDVLNKKNQ